MNDISVAIVGMVLMVSPSAFDASGVRINAAVAPNGTEIESKYDIDIPVHNAFFRVSSVSVQNKFGDTGRLVDDGAGHTRIDLAGDHVQFGTFDAGTSTCNPLPDTGIKNKKSFNDVPRLDSIIDSTLRLKDGAHPAGTDYTSMSVKPLLVAGWLDLPNGAIRATHSDDPTDDMVEFRPTRKTAMLAESVVWHLPNASDCVVLTPFDPTKKSVTLSFKAGKVDARFANESDTTTGESVPGVGYDFEVIYSILKNMPAVPAIPYSIKLQEKSSASQGAGIAVEHIRITTGIDCAPATLQPGG